MTDETKPIDDGGEVERQDRIITLEKQLAETITLLKDLTNAVFKQQQLVLEQAGFIKAITFEINEMQLRREGDAG